MFAEKDVCVCLSLIPACKAVCFQLNTTRFHRSNLMYFITHYTFVTLHFLSKTVGKHFFKLPGDWDRTDKDKWAALHYYTFLIKVRF